MTAEKKLIGKKAITKVAPNKKQTVDFLKNLLQKNLNVNKAFKPIALRNYRNK